MYHIRANAEQSVRNLLRDVAKRAGRTTLAAIDYLDDGSPIQLQVDIDEATGSVVLDFSGTGCEVRGNLNAPISMVHSAVIYCMRAMLDLDISLNAGCLVPLESAQDPPKSLLSPSRTAAVCGGNMLTSRRIVDVVLKAAASQSCNNLTFGVGGKDKDGINIAGWGYYETIAGGSGAGPGWHGTDGVHTHITNTRIADVEILRRYPVLIHQFGLCEGSGRKGAFWGGEGVVRELEVLEPIRTRQLYVLEGGGPGALGRNTWIKQLRAEDGDLTKENGALKERHINIGGKATVWMGKGDRLRIETLGEGRGGRLGSRMGQRRLM
ncbi:Hydantoinase B/oxoprolinase [Mycena olivaceomarginata]|nr:Hydantoinase B/oxoprolinase [Mycena olivaceomarginata]